MKITKEQLKQLIKEALNEDDDWYDEEHETMADRKYADQPQELREPWDGIEANAEMIGDNALKIEYLARKLGVKIPTDPKL